MTTTPRSPDTQTDPDAAPAVPPVSEQAAVEALRSHGATAGVGLWPPPRRR